MHTHVAGSVSVPVDFPFGIGKSASFPKTLCLGLCPQLAFEKKSPGQDRPSGDNVLTVILTASTLHSTSPEKPTGTYMH